MKKYVLAAALVLVSTSALADRTVSGEGRGETKAKACQAAKDNASVKRSYTTEEVDRYSQCDCTQDSDDTHWWSCSVDARLEKRR